MSDKTNKVDSHLLEHRFWLQIMGDHARFIFYSLELMKVSSYKVPGFYH